MQLNFFQIMLYTTNMTIKVLNNISNTTVLCQYQICKFFQCVTHYYWIPQSRILNYESNTVFHRQFSICFEGKLVILKHFSSKNVWKTNANPVVLSKTIEQAEINLNFLVAKPEDYKLLLFGNDFASHIEKILSSQTKIVSMFTVTYTSMISQWYFVK